MREFGQYLCLKSNHIHIPDKCVLYYFEIPIHICIRKIYFFDSCQFPFHILQKFQQAFGEWRLKVEPDWHRFIWFVLFFNVCFYPFFVFHKYCFFESIASKLHYSVLFVIFRFGLWRTSFSSSLLFPGSTIPLVTKPIRILNL